jgi:very-short-patch-repair endonuclease
MELGFPHKRSSAPRLIKNVRTLCGGVYMDQYFRDKVNDLAKKLKPGEWKRLYGSGGTAMWVTSCAGGCGKGVTSWAKKENLRFLCVECREKEKEKDKEVINELSKLNALRRLEIAKQHIEKMYGGISGYLEAFEKVAKKLNTPGWFQSSNEILAAVELIRSKVKARHQVKMGKWKADFVLPELKVVLEIDGGFHKQKDRKEADRIKDLAILASLGPEWEVVRISDDLIKQNLCMLVQAIKETVKERKRVRKIRGGQLPKNYSNTAI